MPIRVKHGGGLPGLTGLLAGQGQYATRESQLRGQDFARISSELAQASGQREQLRMQADIAQANNQARRSMQAASLQAQRKNTQQQIQAQAQRQLQSADQAMSRMAVQAGLQGELKEQQYDLEVNKLKEQARQEASQSKMIYSEKGRRQRTEGRAIVDYASDPNSPLTPQERQSLMQRGEQMQADVPLHAVEDLKPKPPKGFALGDTGTLPGKATYVVGPDNKLIITKFADTEEGVLAAQKIKQFDANVAKQKEHQKRIYAAAAKLVDTEKTPPVSGVVPWGFDVKDTPAVMYSWEDAIKEAERREADVFPSQPAAPPQSVAPSLVAPGEQGEISWYQHPAMKNMPIRSSDTRLPREVGIASVSLRYWNRKYKNKSKRSPELKKEVARAEEILRRFREQYPSISELSEE